MKILIQFILLLCVCWGVHAEEVYKVSKSLEELGSPQQRARLSGWESEHVIKLPKSPREELKSMKLHLEVANSAALIKSRSALTIRLGGKVLGQYVLDPEKNKFKVDLDLPVEQLKVGFNDLVISAVQHYTYQCEDPLSSELWTEIDTVNSKVHVESLGLIENRQPKLVHLPVIFDNRLWVNQGISFVVGTDRISSDQVGIAGLVSQGVSRMIRKPFDIKVFTAQTARGDYADNALVNFRESLSSNSDVVLVGTVGELGQYLRQDILKAVGGPFLGVVPGADGKSMVLIVTGLTPSDVRHAARAIALPEFKHTDSNFEQVGRVGEFLPSKLLVTGDWKPFSYFEYKTTSRRGLDNSKFGFEFRVPSEFVATKASMLKVKLHFSYGAGLRKDSVLNVMVNGHFASAIPLTDVNGAEYSQFEVDLPSTNVVPGLNYLHFEPVFAGYKGPCEMFRPEHMITTIYEDSVVKLTPNNLYAEAPALHRFTRDLWLHKNKLNLVQLSYDTYSVGASLEWLAVLAQFQKRSFDVEVQDGIPDLGSVFVVGLDKHLPEFAKKLVPLKAGYGWNASGDTASLSQFVQGERVINLYMANSSSVLYEGVRTIWKEGLFDGIRGESALVNLKSKQLEVEEPVVLHKVANQSEISSFFSNWQPLVIGALLCAVLFGILFIGLIKRKARRRMGHD